MTVIGSTYSIKLFTISDRREITILSLSKIGSLIWNWPHKYIIIYHISNKNNYLHLATQQRWTVSPSPIYCAFSDTHTSYTHTIHTTINIIATHSRFIVQENP